MQKSGVVSIILILAFLLLSVVFTGYLVWCAVGREKPAEPAAAVQAEPAPERAEPPEQSAPARITWAAEPTELPEPESSPEPPSEPEPETLTLMALGDNLIHNCIYWSAELPEGGYDFTPFYQEIAPLVQSYDIACINQETILVRDAWNISNYPAFGSPTEVGDALAAVGFDVVTCATNHCYDKGMTGLSDTLSFWRESHPEMVVLGLHETAEQSETVQVVERNGIRLAMLNYTYGMNYGRPAERWRIDEFSGYDEVREDLRKAEEAADLTVVFAHWGTEDTFSPDRYEADWAQFLADNGADVIIGGHPHVLQPLETVTASDGREVPVFYSLGNFLSHQTDMINQLGGMASITITKDARGVYVSDYELKPVVNVIIRSECTSMYDYRPMLLEDYTEEIAAQHRFPECTVEAMQALYRQIVTPQ